MLPWFLIVLGLAAAAVWIVRSRWQTRYRALHARMADVEREVAVLRAEHSQASTETRAQQEALFNSMWEGVLLLDTEGRIQWVNRSLHKMFDLTRDVRGLTLLEAFRLRELQQLLERLKSGQSVESFEMELPGMDERWVRVNASAALDPHGRQWGSIIVFHDLTRVKQLENTRQEFVANVSHELRTPLSLIKGYVETLLDGAKDNPDMTTRFLQTIEKHTDRLTYLIEDILTISKLEGGEILMNTHPIPLHVEIERVLEDLRSLMAERDIHAENQVPQTLLVQADSSRLEQVFFNLIENAIKYGRKGGWVRIGAAPRPEDAMVEVWVSDDGPGIPKEAQDRVFERFYRVDRARSRETGGTGLGLSIVKHIIQAHGGEVWVESEAECGTTFHFTLRAG